MYFNVWDVDDPFDQLHGPDGLNDVPNVGVIDNDTGGPDNRGVGQGDLGVGQRTATTNAFGQARVTISVSMQPGNTTAHDGHVHLRQQRPG